MYPHKKYFFLVANMCHFTIEKKSIYCGTFCCTERIILSKGTGTIFSFSIWGRPNLSTFWAALGSTLDLLQKLFYFMFVMWGKMTWHATRRSGGGSRKMHLSLSMDDLAQSRERKQKKRVGLRASDLFFTTHKNITQENDLQQFSCCAFAMSCLLLKWKIDWAGWIFFYFG